VTGVFALYISGFLFFLVALPGSVPSEEEVEAADAIVALTGEGGRLTPAVALLERHKGKRLLISGVNPRTTKRELKVLLHGGSAFDCCTDLGFEATDTRGNAREAAEWAEAHNYKSLIVVTANYHMPRALLEFGAYAKGKRLVPYPVGPDPKERDLLADFPRLQSEYVKYLASLVQVSLFDPGQSA